MSRLEAAADVLVGLALKIYAAAPRGSTAGALDTIRDTLVAELGCSPAADVVAVRGAMLRLAARSESRAVKGAAAAYRRGAAL